MKIIIENTPDLSNVSSSRKEATEWIFYQILSRITKATNKGELKMELDNAMKSFTAKNYCGNNLFIYGFGSHHGWISDAESGLRLIFIEL